MQASSLLSITLCRSDVIPLGDMRSSLNGAENNVGRLWTLGERGRCEVFDDRRCFLVTHVEHGFLDLKLPPFFFELSSSVVDCSSYTPLGC